MSDILKDIERLKQMTEKRDEYRDYDEEEKIWTRIKSFIVSGKHESNSFSHSPDPWECPEEPIRMNGRVFRPIVSNGYIVALIPRAEDHWSAHYKVTDSANAKLIRAAPEMADVLIKMSEYLEKMLAEFSMISPIDRPFIQALNDKAKAIIEGALTKAEKE